MIRQLPSENRRGCVCGVGILFTVYVPDSSPPLGLGWCISRDSRGRRRWHDAGGQHGARSSLVVYPDQQLSIAFASNATGTPGDVLTPSEHAL